MHLAFWLVLLVLNANSEAQRFLPRRPGFPFSHVSPNENAISEGRRLVAYAREVGSIISPFPISPRFLEEKCKF